jgi:hypothetical protein
VGVLAGIDWTSVLVVAVPAYIAALGAALAAILGALNRGNLRTGNGESIGKLVLQTRERTEDLKTPSGSPIGAVAERAEHLSAADVALTKVVHERVTDGAPPPPEAERV